MGRGYAVMLPAGTPGSGGAGNVGKWGGNKRGGEDKKRATRGLSLCMPHAKGDEDRPLLAQIVDSIGVSRATAPMSFGATIVMHAASIKTPSIGGSMSEDRDNYTLLSPSEGGKARARSLSPAQRSAIAKRAAQSRWDARVPIASYSGVLDFVGIRINCAVLPDGMRVISQGDVMEALGRSASRGREAGGNIAPFLNAQNLRPFSSPHLDHALTPIEYRSPGSRFTSTGYDATLLPEICDVYLKARRDGKLLKTQEPYAERAEILMTSLAKIGIVALVDEATGYDKVKDRDELQRLLAQFVEEQFRPWVKRFPNEFFTEVQRIYGHKGTRNSNRRPQYIGRFINDYIYKEFARDDIVLEELQRVNPVTETGRRVRTHHQHLTEGTGIPALDRQIASVITLMKISRDADEFKNFYAQRFPRSREVLRVTPTDDGQVTTLFEMEDFE